VFVKGLLIKGFELRDKVRTYLKQVGTLMRMHIHVIINSGNSIA